VLRIETPTARWIISSTLSATLIAAMLLLSGSTPLPALGWAAAFLFVVVQQDLAHAKVPNAITFPALALALALAAWHGGSVGLGLGVAGAGLVFAILLVPFAIGGMCAGDVKAMMVLGALWGPSIALGLLLWSTFAAGVLAVGLLVLRGGAGEMLKRWYESLGLTLVARHLVYLPPPAGSTSAAWMPRSVALAASVIALQVFGTPWTS
jgi:prepilin peptidase CpaA